MEIKEYQFSATSSNAVLRVDKIGTILYSNKAGELLLSKWGVGIGEKLPSNIKDLVHRVISRNSPEKMEFKVGDKVYLTVFHPFCEEEFVFISGFDISDQILLEGEIEEREAQEKTDMELADIIDTRLIQSLMDDFYKIAHITMALVDHKGNVLVGVGWQDICIKFHRTCPETCKNCLESDTELSSGVSHGKFKLYRCKNGMWDIATPIIMDGHHVGNAFLGQFFFDDEPLNYELFRSQAEKYGFNEEEYIVALEKVPRLNREVVETGMTFIMNLANLLSQISYNNIKLSQTLLKRNYLLDALRESEKREKASLGELSALLDAVPAAVMIAHDPSALIVTGNRLSYEWIRLPRGTNYSKAFPDEKRPETHKLFKNGVEIPIAEMPLRISASGKEVYDYDFNMVYPDGAMRHVLCNARPLYDEQGSPRGAVAAMVDITERKQAEEALNEAYEKLQSQSEELQASNEELQAQSEELMAQTEALQDSYQALCKSEERFRMLFTNMTEAFFLAEIIYNEEGKPFDLRYLEINPAFEIHTGIKREQLLGRSFLDVFAHTDFTGIDNFVEVALSGKSTNFEMFSPPTGRYFDVYAFSSEKGKLAAIFKNVTGRKQMEEALRKSEEKYRNIVETSNEGISIHNSEGKLTYVNQKMAEMLGYDLEEIIGKNMLDFIADIDDSNALDNMNGGDIQSYDFELIRKDGSPIWVLVSLKSFFDNNGEFIGSLNMFTDITERKKAEYKLKETLDNLENLVKERTAELETALASYIKSEKSLSEAQRLAHIGNWEWNISTEKTYWSEEMYRIFGLSSQSPTPSYRELFEYIHPEDRDYVTNKIAKNEKQIHWSSVKQLCKSSITVFTFS